MECKTFLSVFTLVSLTALSAEAGIIFGTGQGGGPGGRDSNWRIVAAPGTFIPPDSQSVPYDTYILNETPWVFIGGSRPPWEGGGNQTGIVFDGITNYWIAPQATASSIAGGSYNWIVAQDFNVEQAGWYDFNFQGAGDNELDFYINGNITNFENDPQRPTITAGTQIGQRAGGFTEVSNFTGSAYMEAGTNTAYMVLWDYGGDTGALIQQSTFQAVPEPSTYALLALAALGLGAYGLRQRRK